MQENTIESAINLKKFKIFCEENRVKNTFANWIYWKNNIRDKK